MVKSILGVDGGGSRTRVLACNADGQPVGLGVAGPSNVQELGMEKATANIREAAQKALGKGSLNDVTAAFFGMAGVVSAADHQDIRSLARSLPLPPKCKTGIDHDIRVALAGGLAGAPGIALIAGTGSSCYGRDAHGNSHQCGGWGSLADDIGGGGWMGRRALEAAVRQADGRQPATELKANAFAFLGIDGVEDFLNRVHRQGLPRHEMARLAPIVMQLRAQGDPAAAAIFNEGLDGLVELVGVTACRLALKPVDIILAGGLMENPTFREELQLAIEERIPEAHVRPSLLPPVCGAALEALVLLGTAITPALVEQLKTVNPD